MSGAVLALVARGAGRAPGVEEIRLPPPGPGEVRVRIRAAGVCHSDLSLVDGTLSPPFPLVLGHEAAGEVVEVGAGTHRARLGDHVALNWAPACRACWFCRRGEPWLCARADRMAVPRGTTGAGEPLHVALGLGALAQQVVVPQDAVVPVPPALPWAEAALLGCALLTGVGAVRNAARVAPGDSVAVFGLGGVGLAVLTAARAAGADPIVAVDLSPAKRQLALAAGATDFLVSDERVSRAVRELTEGRGVDHAVECVGRSAAIRAAWRSARRGGQVTVVGMGAQQDALTLGALEIFHSARTLRSAVYGCAAPDRDIPGLARELLSGALDARPLVTERIGLTEAPGAIDRMARGEGAARSMVVFTD